MTREELKAALKTAKTSRTGRFPLSNGWFVRVERVYPQPARVGPAWFFVFYVESPTGKSFGGQTTMDGMVRFFSAWHWKDEYAPASPETIAEHMEMRSRGEV